MQQQAARLGADAQSNPPGSAPQSAQPVRASVHERLLKMGLSPVGCASDFTTEVHELMTRTPLFAELDPAQTQRLGGFMHVYDVPAGTTLITEGEAGDFMLLLMHGMVDVLRMNRFSYPSRIAVATSGHALGEMSMFDGEPRFASCVALEPCRVAVLTRESLLLVLQEEPRLGNKILLKLVQLLSDRLRQTSGKLVSYIEAARES